MASNATMAADSVYYTNYLCYGTGSTFAFIVATTAITAGDIPWWMLRGVLFWDNQVLVYILNFIWLPLVYYNIILQEVFQQPKLCGGGSVAAYGLPSYEAQMTFTFISFVVSFCILRGKRLLFKNVFMLTTVLFITVWGLWFTGNYEFLHVAAGAVFGTIFGVVFACSIYFFWMESFPSILRLRVVQSYGFHDTLCYQKDTNHSQCVVEEEEEENDKKKGVVSGLYHFMGLDGGSSASDASGVAAMSEKRMKRHPITMPTPACGCHSHTQRKADTYNVYCEPGSGADSSAIVL